MAVLNPQIRTDLSNATTYPQPNAGYPLEFSNRNAVPMRQGVAQAQRDNVRQAQDAIAGAGTTALAFPHDAPKYWMGLTLSEYSRANMTEINTGNVLGAIRLPVPTQLEDVQRVEYDQSFAFGPGWGTIGQNVANGIRGAANQFREGRGDFLSTLAQVGGDVAAGVAQSGAGVGLAALQNDPTGIGQTGLNAVNAFGGLAVNQFYTVLLKGPTYKSYALDFVLQPRTAAESTTIRDIIQILRWAAAPDIAGGGLFWEFPTVVTPTFVPQGNGRNTYMYRFKPAVMTDVGVSYNPFGPPSFYRGTGAPESVRLTIHFLELEYWLKRDF
jgi:hypothetical protein